MPGRPPGPGRRRAARKAPAAAHPRAGSRSSGDRSPTRAWRSTGGPARAAIGARRPARRPGCARGRSGRRAASPPTRPGAAAPRGHAARRAPGCGAPSEPRCRGRRSSGRARPRRPCLRSLPMPTRRSPRDHGRPPNSLRIAAPNGHRPPKRLRGSGHKFLAVGGYPGKFRVERHSKSSKYSN